MAKAAKKKTASKKKLTLGKETVRKLTGKGKGGGKGGGKAQRAPDSYRTCNMKCNSDKSACGC
jgi:hypothetical protein